MVRYKYSVDIPDFKTSEEGRFYSYDLYSEGNTLEELIENAVYCGIDQDGGDGPVLEADDHEAEIAIADWWLNRVIRP